MGVYLRVDEPVHVTGVTLNKSSINLDTVGQTEQLTATVSPNDADNKNVVWSSSNTNIATVSQTGLVTCVTPGSCTITVTTEDGGYTATCGVVKPDYLCFTAQQANSTITLTYTGSPAGVSLETSTDGTTWSDYTRTNTITLSNIGDKVYMRNKSETDTGFSYHSSSYYYFYMTGSISASGDVMYLTNKNSSNTLYGATFYRLFYNCTSLTTPPKLSATTLGSSCYYYMFYGCTNLEALPELPATTLQTECYRQMFYGCSKIKLSTTKTGEYQTAYRIPTTGTGTTASNALANMFASTGGTFTGTPTINTTYYTSNTVV